MASLIEVIDQLDADEGSDRFPPPCIFAEGGPDATPQARALVCDGDEAGSFECPQDPALTYVLEVDLASLIGVPANDGTRVISGHGGLGKLPVISALPIQA